MQENLNCGRQRVKLQVQVVHQVVVSITYNSMMFIFHTNFNMLAVVAVSEAPPVIQENTYDPIIFEEYTKSGLTTLLLFVIITLK
jgi:hypothetical protein